MAMKESYIETFNQEYATTARVLAAYPDAKLDLKPSEKSKTARDLAWTLAGGIHFLNMVVDGNIQFTGGEPPAPKTIAELIAALKSGQAAVVKKIEALTEADFGKPIKFPVGPGKMGDLARGAAMWGFLHDHIHHRGQFTVYLRLAGAKVPSVYGPTADEPWM